MRVVVIGTGYVGLVQGVCLAELGNNVVCIDIDQNKIDKLKKGISPIYEPGINELIKKNLAIDRIKFDISFDKYLDEAEIIFCAVGTPQGENGAAELKYVLAFAEEIGKKLKNYKIIVNKSTVPVGTNRIVQKKIAEYYKGKFDILSNPEFLKEGLAIEDFMHPDRIVIGHRGAQEAAKKLAKLYGVLDTHILITSLETAEMIKYASNSFLANQISFINSISEICEKVGADVTEVAKGMKLDTRIGQKAFLNAGLGYGGSCFPKDVQALIKIARDSDVDFKILEEVENVNKKQRQKFVEKIRKRLGKLRDKKITVWGIAFKPKTDDIREAPVITILENLSSLGVKIIAYDPVAGENLQKLMPQVKVVDNPIDACVDSEALLIITEWDEFKQIDLNKIKNNMKNPIIFDGRNIYSPAEMKKLGFKYYSIGRPTTF